MRRGFPGPRSASRKGLMLRAMRAARELDRDWFVHKGAWQPALPLRLATKARIQALRSALDALEDKL